MSTQTIDRATAFSINPFVSDLYTEDTLERCASTLRALSVLIANDKTGISMEPLYTVFNVICTAMEWEKENVTPNPRTASACGDENPARIETCRPTPTHDEMGR